MINEVVAKETDNVPVVTVLLPVYNEQNNIEKTVNSVLSQTYKNFILLIINDGSTDNTLAELEKYEREDDRIEIVTKKNTGIADTLNKGLDIADGEFIARIDAGDIASKNWLQLQIDIIQSNPETAVVFGRAMLTNSSLEPFYIYPLRIPVDVCKSVMKGKSFPHTFVIYRKDVIVALGGYPAKDGVEDYLLWRNVASRGYKLDVNKNIVGLVIREDDHNNVIQKRLSKRDDNYLTHDVMRRVLHTYFERLLIYKTIFSDDMRKTLLELSIKHPVNAATAIGRALVMKTLAWYEIRKHRIIIKEYLVEK